VFTFKKRKKKEKKHLKLWGKKKGKKGGKKRKKKEKKHSKLWEKEKKRLKTFKTLGGVG